MIDVFLVDDHSLVRSCIKAILEKDTDINVIGEAADGEEALAQIKVQQPHVAVLDIMMPGISCIDVTNRLKRYYPHVKIIILTAASSDTFPQRLLDIGASGYLTKDAGADELIEAIKKVAKGERHITAKVAQDMFLRNVNSTPPSTLDQLSDRELQIMMMIINGQKVDYIADKLCLSPKTVNSHRYRIFDKLGLSNDVELTHFAIANGIIDISAPKE